MEGTEKEAARLRHAEDEVLRTVAGATSIILEMDEELRYVGAWTRDERLLAIPREELLGKRLVDVFPDPPRTWALHVMRSVLETGVPATGEYELDVPAGRRWFRADMERLDRADGSRTLLLHVRDITDRKTAEEAVRRSERNNRELLERTPIGMMVLRQHRIVYANPAWLALFDCHDEREMLGKGAVDLIHPDDLAMVLAKGQEIRAGRRIAPIEYRMVRKDGTSFIVESQAVLIDLDGEPGIVVIARDVTEQRALQARLAAADRMASLGTLAAGVAHEINNPLAYAMTNVQYALDHVRDPKLRSMLGEAFHGMERVRDIVRDLKTLTRGSDEQQGSVDLAGVIRSALQMARHEIKHRACVACELEDGLVVHGNEGRLAQLFLNLLVNAAQAIPEGAIDEHEIRVSARVVGSAVVIEVADTGSGIPPDVLGRIFDPFFTTKAMGMGTGLGLSICHGIVAQLGGTIGATSTPGAGTTLRVVLPLAGRPAESAEIRAADDVRRDDVTAPLVRRARHAGGAGDRRRILVIDDEVHLARALRRILEQSHDATCVHSAQAGLDLLAAGERFDLILCDLMMPEMTGMRFHAEVAARWPALLDRLAFLTGGVINPTAQTFLASIEQPCLEKPFGFDDLLAFVTRHLPQPGRDEVSNPAGAR
jgi:PAS domain S-box-containing protein